MGIQIIQKKIKNKTLKIGIIGLGYVGLPLACEFTRAGISVLGFDISKEKVNQINQGKSYILDVTAETVSNYVKKGLLQATTNFSQLKTVDAISICVPTPLRKTKDPDMSYIESAIHAIKPHLQKGHMIILESTTYPGTTTEVILPELESTGLKVGKDFFLAFSPERVDPGNPKYNTKNTPKIIGGVTKKCSEIGKQIYELAINRVISVSSPGSAEMVKLWENTFRSINIAMANEMALMCDKINVDVWEVIEAATTKPFGFMPFYPGPGLGGHCIPIDPLYLSWKLKSLNYDARFITLADDINSNMPQHVVNKTILALNQHKKSINGSTILILGAAYKANINDVRESPIISIIPKLQKLGAKVSYHDNFIPSLEEEHLPLKSTALTAKTLAKADCVLILIKHTYFDMCMIVKNAKLIVDTRNATKGITSPKIIKL